MHRTARVKTTGRILAVLLALVLGRLEASAQTYHFSTLAGLPQTGTADGPVNSARFAEPHSIALDGTTIYVSDRANHTIRKLDAGVVSTVAGLAGTSGYADGTGTAARFSSPAGIAVGSDNVLYVADTQNHRIRKITSAGVVTTLAGSGTPGSADGTGTAASFNSPIGIAVDASLNVYVSDSATHIIRQITPAGEVTTIAGTAGATGSTDGVGAAARFTTPFGLALDGSGNLFVVATGSHTIRQIVLASATVSTVAGTAGVAGSANGTGTAATFNLPRGIARDGSGNFYVADGGNHLIRKIAPGWVVTKLSGQSAGANGFNDGTANSTLFNLPFSVAVDGTGFVYVTDGNNAAIRGVTTAGDSSTVAGSKTGYEQDGTGANARMQLSAGVGVNKTNGNVYHVGFTTHVLRQTTSRGVSTILAGGINLSGSTDGTGTAARFNGPNKVAVDSAGNIFVADRANHTIRKVTPAGVVTTLAGQAGVSGSADGTGAAATFNLPGSIAVAPDDTLYVTDASHILRQVTQAGVVTTIAGSPGSSGSADGTGSAARFNTPGGMAVDATFIYVADGFNHTVRRVTRVGAVVTTIAGLAGSAGTVDGTGNAARFNFLLDVAMDSAGDLYGVEFGSHTVRRITPAGVVTTIAGLAGTRGSANGSGSTARFYQPTAIAIGKHDVIYIGDRANNVIRMGVKSGTDAVTNGSFATNTTGWALFGLPDMSAIQSNVSGGVFQYYRNGTQAVVFQETGLPLHAGAAVEAQFQIGNSDTVRKRISILLHDSDFNDLSVCTFWLAPGAPLQTYTYRTHTTKAWGSATASFYAATNGSPGGGFYRLDNVSLRFAPAVSTTETICVDPTTPGAPGGSPSATLLQNGDFSSGAVTPGWGLFGQIQGSVTGGVFQFIKLAGTPAGVVLQPTSQTMTANQIITATFQLGNSSSVRKRVTVILHDNDFSDLSACTFWLAPNTPLSNYAYRTFATKAWTNATFSVYPATTGSDQWIRFDNATLQRTPATTIAGTECLEPGSAADMLAAGARSAPSLPFNVRFPGASTENPGDEAAGDTDGPWVLDGFESSEHGGWRALALDSGPQILALTDPIDLTTKTAATLRFESWLTSVKSRAVVEVSVDGETWASIYAVPASATWMPIDIDLSAFTGGLVQVRFVFHAEAAEAGMPPDVWRTERVSVD